MEAPSAPSMVPAYAIGIIVLLIALMSVTVHLGAPFAIMGQGSLLEPTYASTLEWLNHARLQRLHTAIKAYRILNGAPPDSLDQLIEHHFADRSQLTDPWGRPYRYAVRARDYTLTTQQQESSP
jgi:hypothetical protein